MEQLSPITRKTVAVGLAVLLLLLAIQYVVVPLASAIGSQRDELASLRQREAQLRAVIEQPMPAASHVPAGLAIGAASLPEARQRMQALLAGDAAVAGATLQLGAACPSDDPRQLCVEIDASGSEASVARFLSLAEHGPPAARFRSWQLGPPKSPLGQDQSLSLHFSGKATAVWQASK
jgi:hypothetical protein